MRPAYMSVILRVRCQTKPYAIAGGGSGESWSEPQGSLSEKVTSILVDQDWAVVEMFADGVMAKEGWEFDNSYCWVCRFDEVGSSSKLQKYCSATSLELVSSSYTFVLPR